MTEAGVPATPSHSPTAALPCAGDCGGDGTVAVNELVLGVNVALSALPISACPAFDGDGSGTVDIAELIAAVSAALRGCG